MTPAPHDQRTRARIAERVRRLLALAASPNPHEASAARRRADELMLRHGLSEEDLQEQQSDGVFEMSLPSDRCTGFNAEWKWRLASYVAAANNCMAVGLWVAQRRKVRMVGERGDVGRACRLFQLMYEVVRSEGEVVLGDLWFGRPDLGRGQVGFLARSYLQGMVEAVRERISRPRAESSTDDPVAPAAARGPLPSEGVLARTVEPPGVREHVESRYGGESRRRWSERVGRGYDAGAFLEGFERGMVVDLPESPVGGRET